mmetsp:Transcript_121299/g.350277  ORF Transcript_121299/g.350277 Transcript_121299/m.350277 type:complete len:643 (+) Transcript_121299:157-2085(+)
MQALHLGLPRLATGVEVLLHPSAIELQRLCQLLLLDQLRLQLRLHFLRVVPPLPHLSGAHLRIVLLLLQGLLDLSQLVALLQVLRLGFGLLLPSGLDLVLHVLHNHLEGGKGPLRLRLLAGVVGRVPTCLRCLVGVAGVLGLLLLHEGRAVQPLRLVELRQCRDGRLDDLDRALIVVQCAHESFMLLIPQRQHLLQLLLRLLDVVPVAIDLLLDICDAAFEAIDLGGGLLDIVVEVLHVVLVFRCAALTPVPVVDVLLLLFTQFYDHLVNGSHDLVEVPTNLDLGGEAAELQAAIPSSHLAQASVGLGGDPPRGTSAVRSRSKLYQRGGGTVEHLCVLRIAQDLKRLVNAEQLFSPQARPQRPVLGLLLASLLRRREELLVRLELHLRIVALRLAIGQELHLLGPVAFVLLKRLRQAPVLVLFRLHKLLEGLLLLAFFGIVLLEVCRKAVVQAFQNALDLRGLRRVVAEGVVRLRQLEDRARLRRRQIGRRVDETSQHLQVPLRCLVCGDVLRQHSAHIGCHTEQLRLVHRVEERLLLLACSAQCPHGRLEGAHAVLGLGPVSDDVRALHEQRPRAAGHRHVAPPRCGLRLRRYGAHSVSEVGARLLMTLQLRLLPMHHWRLELLHGQRVSRRRQMLWERPT